MAMVQLALSQNLRDGLFAIVTPLRQASPITVKTDNAAAFQGLVRKNDPHLQKAEITLVLSEVMNKNSNAVIDKGILELEKELLNLQPDGQPISQTTLSIAINNLNSKRLRRNGKLTASEIHTSRDAWSGANLSLECWTRQDPFSFGKNVLEETLKQKITDTRQLN